MSLCLCGGRGDVISDEGWDMCPICYGHGLYPVSRPKTSTEDRKEAIKRAAQVLLESLDQQEALRRA